MMEKLMVLFLFSAALLSCKSNIQNDRKNPHYEIFLIVDPVEKHIEVKGKLIIPPGTISSDGTTFYLDSSLFIETISCQDVQFKKDTSAIKMGYMPSAVNLAPVKPIRIENNTIALSFSYKGKLSELPKYFGNIISEDWTELGLYYPWFPYSSDISLYTYKVTVQIDKRYNVFGMGKTTFNGTNYIIENQHPTNDIVVCASKDVLLSHSTQGDFTSSIYHHNVPDSVLPKLHHDFNLIYAKLSNLYGEAKNEITVIISKRETGGGYARIGGIFLGGFHPGDYFDKEERYYRYFAHEIAHLWWFKADVNSWEDWLNEGIAEYSALAIIRDLFGEESFHTRLSKKKESCKNSDPLWEFDRMSKNAYSLLYNKAPLLLFSLEEKIGKSRFNEFLNRFLSDDIHSTKNFLNILEEHEGQEITDWFINELKTK
ncbi:M1 family aminopeptidase [Draconibacterium sediminis]|uniref:Peptidase M1 membrane alanine aminopeptidase domain-containing protein n=1 Tax=Draconibacterium sediminis TaxID=1544798 RepID=A0A0D8J6M2_9BACT|nr:M1 family aminopeptidase [Draconibacterium sediminis]KJF42166.1 hypothetical protein LH29_20385 [Draconibacterium sediminis]